jgi:hypothetical protein
MKLLRITFSLCLFYDCCAVYYAIKNGNADEFSGYLIPLLLIFAVFTFFITCFYEKHPVITTILLMPTYFYLLFHLFQLFSLLIALF